VSDRLKDELRALGDRMPPSWALDLPPHCGAAVRIDGGLGLFELLAMGVGREGSVHVLVPCCKRKSALL
jgi:hypothetical protein